MSKLVIILLSISAVCGAEDVKPSYLNAPHFGQKDYFRLHLKTNIPRVELQAPSRLEDFVVGDKIELSLKSYLELVMLNNTNIQLLKLNVEQPRNAILRAFGRFDPVVTARYTSTRRETPSTDILAGAATLSQLSQPYSFAYNQTLSTGTTITTGFDGSRISDNNQFRSYNPAYSIQSNINISQPLMRNRGSYVWKLPVLVAQSQLKGAEYSLHDQVIQALVQAETAYWNVVEARENLRVQELALKLSEESLKRSTRELELGAISPLEIYQPQAQYANAEIFVTQAKYRLAQTEDILRRQISLDLNPKLRNLPIVLTEPVAPPTETATYDKEELVSRALRTRPDLKQRVNAIDTDDLQIKQQVNLLRPDVALTANYSSQGRGGPYYQRTITGDTTVSTFVPGGPSDALGQMFGFGYPVYGFGLNIRLPIRDRAAKADYADAVVRKRMDTLQIRQTEQQIRQEVLTALNNLENSKASVKLAQVARDLAQKRVEAEQKRYELGTTTIFFVLAAQNDFTVAESALVTQSISYRRNLLQLLQRTGELLEARGVQLQY